MLSLTEIFGNIVKSKKTSIKSEKIVITDKSREASTYGDELLCARYYNLEETQYIDLYIPYMGPIGLWLSGGADSSMLAFLLAKTIKDHNLNIKIMPMCFKRNIKPWNLSVATNVIEKIEKILDIKKGDIFLNPNYCYFGESGSDDFSIKMEKHITMLKMSKLITIVYSGLTKNPDLTEEDLLTKRVLTRDNPEELFKDKDKRYIEEKIISNPFMFQNKLLISDLYKKHDLIESLLPYTRSCESLMKNTNFFKESCGTCWWCKERKWAFEKYTKDSLKHIPPSNKMKKECNVV
jgi:hypothetical protein